MPTPIPRPFDHVIGELVRDGATIYYATLGPEGVYVEHADRAEVEAYVAADLRARLTAWPDAAPRAYASPIFVRPRAEGPCVGARRARVLVGTDASLVRDMLRMMALPITTPEQRASLAGTVDLLCS